MSPICPCQSGKHYQQCCEPLHQGKPAPSAERLMRSRYSAYVLKLTDYLCQSWHHSTRPAKINSADLADIDSIKLEIVDTGKINPTEARVSFKAHYTMGNNDIQVLHETSRFILETNAQNTAHWFYVDGVIHQDR